MVEYAVHESIDGSVSAEKVQHTFYKNPNSFESHLMVSHSFYKTIDSFVSY